MANKTIRIATRQSPLALWQAEHVAARLQQAFPGLKTELVKMVTRGDKILDAPLAKVGGKGLFVKELEQGMLDGVADIAVHSMKDVPVEFPEGLHLAVILDPLEADGAHADARLDRPLLFLAHAAGNIQCPGNLAQQRLLVEAADIVYGIGIETNRPREIAGALQHQVHDHVGSMRLRDKDRIHQRMRQDFDMRVLAYRSQQRLAVRGCRSRPQYESPHGYRHPVLAAARKQACHPCIVHQIRSR